MAFLDEREDAPTPEKEGIYYVKEDPDLGTIRGLDPWAVENGITTGTSATTFSPEAPCTRRQIVTFLWRAAGEPEPETSVNPFTDTVVFRTGKRKRKIFAHLLPASHSR